MSAYGLSAYVGNDRGGLQVINPKSKIGAAERDGGTRKAGVAIASSLQFENISHAYDGESILKNISLEVEPGEVLCLLGPSGSGKTTLLRIAAGLEDVQTGRVIIDGSVASEPGRAIPPENRGVGLVFQDFALFPHLSIVDNVAFGLKALKRKQAREEAVRLLALVGLKDYADAYPHQLSGGEQQRVALARAFAPRPRILLMDEPFSGLDARLRDAVREETVALLRDSRSTAVIVTHDPEEALRVGDHIALMRKGRLVQHGTGHELYYQPESYFAAQFFTELNSFSCKAGAVGISTPLGTVENNGIEDGAHAQVCVRLSDIKLEAATAKGGTLARIRDRQFMGMVELIDIVCEGHDKPIRVRSKAGMVEEGVSYVRASINEGCAMVFPQNGKET